MTVKEERKTNNGTNVLFERTVCEMNATEKKPGDYYLYLCELLHEEICWKRGRFVMV